MNCQFHLPHHLLSSSSEELLRRRTRSRAVRHYKPPPSAQFSLRHLYLLRHGLTMLILRGVSAVIKPLTDRRMAQAKMGKVLDEGVGQHVGVRHLFYAPRQIHNVVPL